MQHPVLGAGQAHHRPIEDISEAARRLGSGDFTARAPVDGCVELADFATTFNNMAARLQTIDNSRGQFMGNIAHELRTPMTTIKGFIDGMLDGTIPPEETKHYLGIVSQETGRLARLVQNMLDITKLEAGEVPIHAQTYDLWKTVTDVVLSDEQRIEDGKIDIQGLGGDPLLIYADPDFVHQVVYNIVDNAIKFTPAGGTISFAAERRGNMVEVRIENTGAGIAPEALPFVFERFYKEDRSRGTEHPRQRTGAAYLQDSGQPFRRPDPRRERGRQLVPVRVYAAGRAISNRITDAAQKRRLLFLCAL